MVKKFRGPAISALIGAAIAYRLTGRLRGPSFRHGTAWYSLDPALEGHWGFYIACIAGWALFSLYWEAEAKKAAAAKNSESSWSRGLHVTLVSLAQLMVLAPIRGLGRDLPVSSLVMASGLLAQAMGTFLAVWARRHLGRNWSGAVSITVEHRLVRSGPYRRLRHPIYTGLLAMYIGPAMVTGEWLGLAGVVVVVVAYLRKLRLEEARLAAEFGGEYAEYRRESWAWVPGVY
jgi:protein-S-isoprenylcysteine O-methyltransferase Ste14